MTEATEAAPEVETTEAAEPAAEAQAAPDQAPDEQPEKPPKTFTEEELNRKIQKRLERAQRSFERKLNETLEAERQRYSQQQVPRETQGEPKLEQFDNFDDYVRAKAEFIVSQKLDKSLSERQQREAQEYQARTREQLEHQFKSRAAKFRAEAPDFDDVVESAGVEISIPVRDAILESDVGPRIAYYLAQHPDEAESIAAMPPVSAVRAIGRIEAKLERESVVKTSSAPKPVKPVGAKGSTPKSIFDTDNIDDFIRMRQKQVAARGR